MPPWTRAVTRPAIALALALAWSGPAGAQDFDPDRVSITLNIFEAQVQYPPPSWQRTASGQNEHEYHRNQQGPVFIFEQIPKGETFQDWSKMQAVLGVYGAAKQGMPFRAFVERSIGQFVTVCGEDHFRQEQIAARADAATIVVYCEDTANAPAQPAVGYGPGVGEIALLVFRRQANTYLKIYHEWRGASFTASDPNTWPVSKAVVGEMIRRYQNIRVRPWQGPSQ